MDSTKVGCFLGHCIFDASFECWFRVSIRWRISRSVPMSKWRSLDTEH